MILRIMRFVGALAVLAVGAIHLQQYFGADYRAIPTIGTLFLLNATGSAIVGIALLAPITRVLAALSADATIGLLALAAVAIAAGALAALFISESGGLFVPLPTHRLARSDRLRPSVSSRGGRQ